MSEVKYTLGPWVQYRYVSDNKLTSHVFDSKGELVAHCHGGWDQRLINARLIAAAPEMLEALQKVLIPIELLEMKLGTPIDGVSLAKSAIAKATGKEVS